MVATCGYDYIGTSDGIDKPDNFNPTAGESSCLDCPKHQVIPDPDPDDWFCDDDKAVVCKLALNDERDTSSKWASDHSVYRSIARSARPHHLKKESNTPDWCPKLQRVSTSATKTCMNGEPVKGG
ncbi:hypothetical protein [Neptuniibacter sp. QD37_11]|uniref:hypothetical protein n=1 Tax=Neptuniibacter sp. QD37_11 TaxID=3398209 RepID=UPI0039F581B9